MAVTDVFGALTEDRPYHKAMPCEKVMSIISKLAGSNGLDADVVKVLEQNYDDIYEITLNARRQYIIEQQKLLKNITAPAVHLFNN